MTAHPFTIAAERRKKKTCAHCKSVLHPDEFPKAEGFDWRGQPYDQTAYLESLRQLCGGPVCVNCDDMYFVECRASGFAVKRSEAFCDADGEYYASQKLANDADYEAEIWELEKRSMRSWI